MADADLLRGEVSAYLKPQDVEHVREAIEFSRKAHEGQLRKSGDPYVTHPIAVARILTLLRTRYWPKTTSSPSIAALTRFIAGEPMKPATNRFAGRS